MKITFGSYDLQIWDPHIRINARAYNSTSVDLEFCCTYEEYTHISNGAMLVYNTFHIVKIENGNHLFILNDAVLSQIGWTNILGVSEKEGINLNITLFPKKIICEDLNDVFME